LSLRLLLVIAVVQRSRTDIYRLPALSSKTVGKVGQRAQNPMADPHTVLWKRLALRVASLNWWYIRWLLGALRCGILRSCGADRLLLVNWHKIASSSSTAGLMPLVWHEIEVGLVTATVLLPFHYCFFNR